MNLKANYCASSCPFFYPSACADFFQPSDHHLSRTLRCARISQNPNHFIVTRQDFLPLFSSRQNPRKLFLQIICGHSICHEFCHNFMPCYQVHQRDIFHLQNMAAQKRNELSCSRIVAHHLVNTKESRFKSGRTAGHKSGRSILQQPEVCP